MRPNRPNRPHLIARATLLATALAALPASAADVSVALIDTGARSTHRALADLLGTGYDALSGTTDTRDALGHGTHVAGVLAESARAREAGVRLLPVRVVAGPQGATDATLSAGLRWAAARSDVVNLSLSATAPIAATAMREAVAGGTLLVVAAGNRSAANPDWPARFARESWANGATARGAVIAVGALDASGRIADFSNRAGDAAEWFLVAPGTDITSAWASGDAATAQLSGTSMAAPAVTGAAARLRAQWPRLSAKDAAAILLATARDLGAPGTDAVYGRGLLDAEAAMRPVGELHTKTAAGTVPLAATGLRLSSATVALGQAAARGGLPTVALDAYARDYSADLGARIAMPLPQQVVRAFDAMDERMERIERVLPNGARLSLQSADAFSLTGRDAAGDFTFAAGTHAREVFGIAAGLGVPALAHPYAGLGPRGALLARGLAFGDTRLRAGFVGGAATESSGAGWTAVDTRTAVLEVQRRVGDALALTATWTQSAEQGAWLGAVGTGAFAAQGTVRTEALQLGAAWAVAPRTVLAATWSQGRTPAHGGAGVFETVGDSRSDAGSIALVQRDALLPGDGLSIALSQPMRTRSGEAVATLQGGVDEAGDAVLVRRAVSLVPTGRERVVELAWRAPAGRDAAISAVVSLRSQPNHDAQAPDDALVALRYRRAL